MAAYVIIQLRKSAWLHAGGQLPPSVFFSAIINQLRKLRAVWMDFLSIVGPQDCPKDGMTCFLGQNLNDRMTSFLGRREYVEKRLCQVDVCIKSLMEDGICDLHMLILANILGTSDSNCYCIDDVRSRIKQQNTLLLLFSCCFLGFSSQEADAAVSLSRCIGIKSAK